MENMNINVPYPIRTYLSVIEDGKKHIDQVYEYSINHNGIFATLLLDAKENPRLSTKISIEELNKKWTLAKDVNEEKDITALEVFDKVKRKVKIK